MKNYTTSPPQLKSLDNSQNLVKINNTKFPDTVTKTVIGEAILGKTVLFTLLHNIFGLLPFNVPSEFLTPVTIKSSVFWDITPCSPVKVSRRFGRTYCPHLQNRRASKASSQYETGSK
jgi:hypothetical protein